MSRWLTRILASLRRFETNNRRLQAGPDGTSGRRSKRASRTTISRLSGAEMRPSSSTTTSGPAAAAAAPRTPYRPYTIVVEGNIGAGKTTFLKPFTSDRHGWCTEVSEEPVALWRNLQGFNLLNMMYQDPKRWSFMFQTYVQLTMIQQHTRPAVKPIRVMERSLLSARYCFVENLYNSGNLTDAEHAILSEWFNFLIVQPNLDFKVDQIVYLRTDPEVAFDRIKERSRAEEQLIPFSYIKDLHNLHEDWLVRKTKFQPLPAPVTVIDANRDLGSLETTYQEYEEQLISKAMDLSRNA